MRVENHDTNKLLKAMSKLKAYAEIHERIRIVMFAKQGQTLKWIANKLDVAPTTVVKWVGRYNEGGLDGLYDLPRSGQPTRITEKQMTWLINRLEAGPGREDETNVFRGKDVMELIKKHCGVTYSLSAIYVILSRLGYSYIKPRPVHPQNNPEEMRTWLKKNDAQIYSRNKEKP